MDEEHNKFTAVEILLGVFFTLSVDGICALIDLTGVGLAIAPLIQGFATFALWMWFKSKNDPGINKLGRQIAKYAANFLPLLPTTFLAFVIEVYLHNHPEKFAAVQKVATIALQGAVTVATGGTGGVLATAALKTAGGVKAAAALKAVGGAEAGMLKEVAGGSGEKALRNVTAARKAFAGKPAPAEETKPEEDNPLP